jgi:osomolarity two-component system response regulator SKN7
MNDVLAKPFTRDGMVRILKKHLSYMLKDPQSAGLVSDDTGQGVVGPIGPGPGPPASSQAYGGPPQMTMAGMVNTGQVKFEQTPIQSPATTSSWHSPGQMSHTSPNNLDGGGGYTTAVGSGPGGMVLTPGGTQTPQYAQQVVPQVATPSMGRMASDVMIGGGEDDRPEKRQRLYGPSQGAFVN